MAATVSFRLHRPKSQGKLKTTPVTILIAYYHSGVEVEVSCGLRVAPAQWLGTRVSKEAPRAAKMNKILSDIENKLLNIELDHPTITPEAESDLARAIIKRQDPETQKKTGAKTVVGRLLRFMVQFKKDHDPESLKKYVALTRHLVNFQKRYRLTWESISTTFYDNFRAYMYEMPATYVYDAEGKQILRPDGRPKINFPNYVFPYNKLERISSNVYEVVPAPDFKPGRDIPVPIMDDTVYKYLSNFKRALRWIRQNNPELPIGNGFEAWKILKKEYPVLACTQEELEKIETASMPSAQIKYAGDMFSLESRTGQRVSDWKRFNENMLNGMTLTFTQKKGNRELTKQITLPLEGFCNPALAILRKYKFSLNQMSEPRLNELIREAGRIAGIDKHTEIIRWAGNKKIIIAGPKWKFLSTHTGRATFVTIMLEKEVSHNTVMQLTGIRSLKTLAKYTADSEEKVLAEQLRKTGDSTLMRKVV